MAELLESLDHDVAISILALAGRRASSLAAQSCSWWLHVITDDALWMKLCTREWTGCPMHLRYGSMCMLPRQIRQFLSRSLDRSVYRPASYPHSLTLLCQTHPLSTSALVGISSALTFVSCAHFSSRFSQRYLCRSVCCLAFNLSLSQLFLVVLARCMLQLC